MPFCSNPDLGSREALLPGRPREFLKIRRVFATSSLLAEEFPDNLENVRMLYNVSRYMDFLDYLDTLHIIWIFCIAKYPEILQPIMNLSQKLSGFAKTFRSALLTR